MPMLTGPQIKPLQQALLSAFTRESLTQMLSTELNKQFEQLVKDTDFNHQVFLLIDRANREGWVYKLLLAAGGYNPDNPDLQACAAGLNLAAIGTPTTTPALESMIQKNNSYLDAAVFRARQGWVETAVCRIKIGGSPAGTGFLVGPGTVLTNYHVLPKVIAGSVTPAAVTCQFDYKQLPDGQPVSQGIEVGLAGDGGWLIAAAPPTAEELAGTPKTVLPGPAELDFALLRLEQEIATVALGVETPITGKNSDGPQRAWLAFATGYTFVPHSPLWIMQHPKAQPLKLALATDAVEQVNQNNTRVTYRTNTERGSSGSPVFDQNWNLVALHHLGDPDWFPSPHHNEGIPVASIRSCLAAQNLASRLGRPH